MKNDTKIILDKKLIKYFGRNVFCWNKRRK